MKVLFPKIIIIFFLYLPNLSHAQHQTDNWYFGNYAGLNFRSGFPEPLNDGALETWEGCAGISDSTGQLLFYTNGTTVWNKEHQIMDNGYDLMGDTNSTQAAIIVPQPGNTNIYYIVTTDVLHDSKDNNSYFTNGLRYTVTDISQNAGSGSVILKNQILLDSTLEKITAVKHQNNKDYWIIAHEWGSADFYSWLVTESGITESPMISTVGYVYESEKSDAVGYMKINPGGNTIAVALSWESKFEIFSFDNSTGLLAFLFEIPIGNQVYGCEFSSDGSKLYLSSQFNLFQVDMNAGTPENIINSLTEIHQFDKPIGASQLAVNGKIYITCDTSEFLSVIKNPNELPNNCGFEYNAVFLDGSISSYGLPNFIPSYFIPPIFNAENVCFSDETLFIIKGVTDIDSVLWNFDDPDTGNLNFSNALSPVHVFSRIGSFYVTLTVWFDGIAYIYSQNTVIVPLPDIELGNDTALCNIDGYELNACGKHLSYLWNNFSTDSVLLIDTSGTYSVQVENIYTTCKNADTVNIIFSELPEINFGNDTSFCEHTIYTLDAWNESCTYRWQDHSTNPFFYVSEPGTYYVYVKNQFGCKNSDTIVLTLNYPPVFQFPSDTVLCDHTLWNLMLDLEDAEYVWQDGSRNNSFLIEQPGEYILTTLNRCGSWSDSIIVSYKYCGDIYIPNILTPNGDDYNNVFIIKGIEDQSWSLYIYNRWGQEVMFFDRYDNSWTGRDQNGTLLSEGVYYYRLINTMHNQSFSGTVRLFK